ncbi:MULTISPECIES: hypothetical protein [Mesobacillus]|uniref:Uncharacterized protein n=2 Tax=Mesobacillus TaxID=2675231 RepID=A0A0D6ZBX1_9BACI|nr:MULTISPECIES: hypothetical protein [Mesobacillus]KIY22556.1 hypothetical protein UB32_07750 [Mesobacillus subterraneus]MDQ0415001.1 hypothetical protein [Mesobacillus stamsii]
MKLAKGDIEDTPAQEIITDSKILSRDLKKLLIEYIEEQEKAGSKDRVNNGAILANGNLLSNES